MNTESNKNENRNHTSDVENGFLNDGLSIRRPVYQLDDFNKDSGYERPNITLKDKCKKKYKSFRFLNCVRQSLPVLDWLPRYKCKNLFGDVVSGVTVSILHIPHGMAYGLIGNVPPVSGIYMAFFPVLIYFIFGTSRHVSIGTFSIVCLMTGSIVSKYNNVDLLKNDTSIDFNPELPQYTNVEIATTVTFTVALIQLLMYGLRLGVLTTLLSETLVNGFTCAAAFVVVSSQLKDLFGIPVTKRRGNFAFVYAIYDAIVTIPEANKYACAVSAISVFILMMNNEFFKPFLAKKTQIPFPIELFAVILGTSCSYFLDFNDQYDISVVGTVPTGFPAPTLPAISLIPDILLDSFIISMVSYTVTMSMALIIARKVLYEVNSNQELLALGLSNTMGSFFSCMPVSASLSRTLIQQAVGGVTQLASLVSCAILLVVLLWIGPCFETLPRCVLASIIIVALKGMLLQCKSLPKYWKLSKWDALVWIITFSTTLFIQISYGLFAGIATSLLSVFIQGYKPYNCLLGVVPNTDLYLDIKRYKKAQEIDGIKIFRYSGGLSFATGAVFKESLNKNVGFDPHVVLRRKVAMEETHTGKISEEFELLTKFVILDFSAVTFVDPAAVAELRVLQKDYAKLDIQLYLAACSGPVYEKFIICDQYEQMKSNFMIFPAIHDAVLFAQNQLRTEVV